MGDGVEARELAPEPSREARGSARDVNGASGGDWLVGGGEMAKLIKAKDWSQTPLGPIESWPQSLRTTVSLAQASNSPISLAWGEGNVQIYNDGYWPICGAKHPVAMGQDFRECWASAFPVLDEAYASAWSGKSAYLEKVRMFLDRYGFLEETWFTFSFSPITGETGKVAGLFHPVTELTAQMLSERRAQVLRELANRTAKARTSEEAFNFAIEALAEASLDLPFALLYSVSADGGQARRVGQVGIEAVAQIAPELINLSALEVSLGRESKHDCWRVDEVALAGAALQIDDVAQRLAGLSVGPYPELPKVAFTVPIMQPGKERPTAVLVVGVSSRLPLNDLYRDFMNLVAAAISSALANARAYEEERNKSEALAQIDRAKTVFFSNVSHEFRTPLTLILGPLEDELEEREEPLPPVRRARLETAHRNSLRMLKLVNTLLDFSRIEAGRIQANYQATDLALETAELASAFRSAFERAGLSLTVDCPRLPERIYIDREMWEKIVLNLLSNALKHTFQGGVTVRQCWHDDHVLMTVSDTGVGIPAAELPRLFERFHRVVGAQSRSHEGTGIGLALVNELVHLHQGSVSVESREQKGTTFSVMLKAGSDHLPADKLRDEQTEEHRPLRVQEHVQEALQWLPETGEARAPAPERASEHDSPVGDSDARNQSPARGRARVVWADDNADMREYVRRLLAPHYQVFAVGDGEAALRAVHAERPDLVLSDVMMPGLDGFGLLKKLRADPETRNVPVILLSARAGEESAIEGLSAGADDYLVKPFSAKELYARVRTHLELARERRGRAEELERANQELGTFSYSVSHDLRAPLRAIDGFSKALLSDYAEQFDETGRHYLKRIRAGSQRMSTLIDDLLSLSRISRAPLKRDVLNLSSIAESVTNELRAREPAREVISEVARGLMAHGDAHLLTIALENLLGNAFKFTSKAKRAQIWVGQERREHEQIFFVRDTGAGFDMTYANKLFAPFQRLHADTEFEGTGIGLATVQRIISRHGGRIWADAVPGQGATFFFTLAEAP
jgi:signal transduction histidine kinase